MILRPLTDLFVTGTDTGVGKTTVGCALLRCARVDGHAWLPWKPVETGCDGEAETDAERLARAAGCDASTVGPLRLRMPASPARAARAEGVTLALDALLERAQAMRSGGRPLLVEGAGGLLVPFAPGVTFAELAAALSLPVLVVARDALGTVNHTLLTVEALRRRGLAPRAVALNAVRDVDARALENAQELQAMLPDVPVLGPLPWGDDAAIDAAVRGCGLLDLLRSGA
jgi:dethiobiotin synthetase